MISQDEVVPGEGIETATEPGEFDVTQRATVAETTSGTVVERVAAEADTTPTALEPLYERVDPDALERFVASLDDAGAGAVRFSYEGCDVRIDGDGSVEVSPGGRPRR
jgi:hypothetical protein